MIHKYIKTLSTFDFSPSSCLKPFKNFQHTHSNRKCWQLHRYRALQQALITFTNWDSTWKCWKHAMQRALYPCFAHSSLPSPIYICEFRSRTEPTECHWDVFLWQASWISSIQFSTLSLPWFMVIPLSVEQALLLPCLQGWWVLYSSPWLASTWCLSLFAIYRHQRIDWNIFTTQAPFYMVW